MKNISKALLEVQKNLDPIHKGRQGYGYKYADLATVLDAVLDALNKAGVVMVQSPARTDKMAACIVTRLIHADSGEEIQSEIEVPYAVGNTKMSEAQAYGSAITYAKRYAIVSMIGVVTEDDDGASAGKQRPVPVITESQREARAKDFLDSFVLNLAKAEDPNASIFENQDALKACLKYSGLRDRAEGYLRRIDQ